VVPVYNDDDWNEAEAEDEAGNISVRKAVGVRVRWRLWRRMRCQVISRARH
jgi:hypothetical protein